jgi:hypothetical protein
MYYRAKCGNYQEISGLERLSPRQMSVLSGIFCRKNVQLFEKQSFILCPPNLPTSANMSYILDMVDDKT